MQMYHKSSSSLIEATYETSEKHHEILLDLVTMFPLIIYFVWKTFGCVASNTILQTRENKIFEKDK